MSRSAPRGGPSPPPPTPTGPTAGTWHVTPPPRPPTPSSAPPGDGPRHTPTWPPTSRTFPPRPSLPVSPGAGIVRAARLVPARIRHGRPWHLLARALAAAVLSLLVVHLLPGQPSGPAIVTGLVIWFVLTARGDLAPPPGR